MTRLLVIYNLLLPFAALIMLPGWFYTMWRRRGFGSGLRERLGIYGRGSKTEKQASIYVHAVSVGEVQLAKKLIAEWQRQEPEAHFVLVPTTATGRRVADEAASPSVRVIYSPLDFRWVVRRALKRFQPRMIVLMESELWPNLIDIAGKWGIPVGLANARLSQRSARRYGKLGWLISPLFAQLDTVCVPDEGDLERWQSLGVACEATVHTGSIKYDQSGTTLPQKREEFSQILHALEADRPIVCLSSTHDGEELALVGAIKARLGDSVFFLVVPRHEERRAEVAKAMRSLELAPVLRSECSTGELGSGNCLIVDVTGELRDWTAHADVVVVGKSFLASGGQSPVEAIAAAKPTVLGADMRNFAPLVASLKEADAIWSCETVEDAACAVEEALGNEALRNARASAARGVLQAHFGATTRTVEALESMDRETPRD